MGSPASPALCNLVVAVVEQCWSNTCNALIANDKHFHRNSHTTSSPNIPPTFCPFTELFLCVFWCVVPPYVPPCSSAASASAWVKPPFALS